MNRKNIRGDRSSSLLCVAFSLLIVVGAGTVGCSKEGDAAKQNAQQAAPEPATVSLAPATVQPLQRTVEVVGTLYGDEETVISAKVAGRVTRIVSDVGDRVAPGESLAELDKTDYELSRSQHELAVRQALSQLGLQEFPQGAFDPEKVPTVLRAKLQAANAEAKLNRGKQLYAQQPPLMSEQDYADLDTAFQVAKSDYEVALLTSRSLLAEAQTRQSELNQALQQLADTVVRAPANSTPTTNPTANAAPTTQGSTVGRYAVAARLVSLGEYVREGTPMYRLVADDPIKFRAQVPERFMAGIKIGQGVDLSVESYENVFAGTLARLSPQIDIASRTFQIETLVNNPTGTLRAGAFARGAIKTHMDPRVTFVPQQSIVSFAGIKKVFGVKDGKAVEWLVTTGVTQGNLVEIVKGIPMADGAPPDIVITNAAKLSNGTPLNVVPATEAEAKSAATTQQTSSR